MAIIINIDVMLAKRKMNVTELSEKVGITMVIFWSTKVTKTFKDHRQSNSSISNIEKCSEFLCPEHFLVPFIV